MTVTCINGNGNAIKMGSGLLMCAFLMWYFCTKSRTIVLLEVMEKLGQLTSLWIWNSSSDGFLSQTIISRGDMGMQVLWGLLHTWGPCEAYNGFQSKQTKLHGNPSAMLTLGTWILRYIYDQIPCWTWARKLLWRSCLSLLIKWTIL